MLGCSWTTDLETAKDFANQFQYYEIYYEDGKPVYGLVYSKEGFGVDLVAIIRDIYKVDVCSSLREKLDRLQGQYSGENEYFSDFKRDEVELLFKYELK